MTIAQIIDSLIEKFSREGWPAQVVLDIYRGAPWRGAILTYYERNAK